MAEYKFTAALNAADIPPTSRAQPRSVIIGQMDNKLKNPAGTAANNQDNNPQNLPQVIYAENVMPTETGFSSVGYRELGDTFFAGGFADEIYTLRSGANTWVFCPAQGRNYWKNATNAAWSASPIPGFPSTAQFSIAYVNGETYICYAYTYLGLWNGAGFTDVTAALTGITIANVAAIAGAGNYLIAADANTGQVQWSSLTNPLDFTPSVTTGAGAQIPLDLRGALFYLTPTSGGFICHCRENAVAAVYTQNSAAPWIFREVKGSGGARDNSNYDQGNFRITKDNNGGSIFMYASNGLQSLNLREAENIHPQITDFLASQVYETFNTATNLLSLVKNTRIRVKLAFIANRYLVISYGAYDSATLSYALVFDSTLKRWGKLKVDHADIFGFQEALTSPRDLICLVTETGLTKQIVFDQRTGDADSGVLILGRYQISRTHQICSQELELEVLDSTETVTAHVATNYNGTTVGQILAMTEYTNTENYRCFQKQIEGTNISFIIKGTFTLATALITATKGAAT
jgi:hypothetical protein